MSLQKLSFAHLTGPSSGRFARSAALSLCVVVAAFSTGCLLTPGDGEFVGSIEAPVTVSGVSGYADELIQIQAWHSASESWHTVKSIYTDASSMPGSDGELFEYSTTVVLPNQYWLLWDAAAIENQFKASIRTRIASTGELCYTPGGEEFATIWGKVYPTVVRPPVKAYSSR